jgi:tetratricopeptide (TPR) repeat protein
MNTGQWQQAEDLLTKALAGSPEDAATRRSLAEALWHRDARTEAITQIEKAVEHDEDNSALRVRAGEMALATGAKDAALAHANRAIRNDPQSPTAWALRAHSFHQMNQPDRALADLQQGIELAPDDSGMLLEVATMYRQRGLPERSLTTIHHLLDTFPPGEEPQDALTIEGLTLLDLGRPQQACESLAMAMQRGKPSADGFYHLAKAYTAAGDFEKAAGAAQQALAFNASHQPSRELLTQLAARTDPAAAQRR